jgi:hypothetical protein
MVDLVFWGFFGLGFVVMVVMILVFQALWDGRSEEIWKGISGNRLGDNEEGLNFGLVGNCHKLFFPKW